MAFLSIFNSILNEKMLNFWCEKCIFEQKKSPKNFHYVPGTKIKILPDSNMKKMLKMYLLKQLVV